MPVDPPAGGRPAHIGDSYQRLRAAGARKLADRVQTLVADWRRLNEAMVVSGAGLGDPGARRRLAALLQDVHRIAGSAGTFGYPDVSGAAAPLEALLTGLADSRPASLDWAGEAERHVRQVHAAWLRESADNAGARLAADPSSGPPVSGEAAIGVLTLEDEPEGGAFAAIVGELGYPIRRIFPEGVLDPDLAAAIIDGAAPGALEVSARLGPHCPVLLASPEASFASRLAASRAGVTAVVQSPLDADELADWLDALAGRSGEAPFSILVVDDDDLLAEAYASSLRRAGMRVTVVSRPDQALNDMAAAQHDLILMDLQMPEVNGLELARVIRQTRRHLFLPIVFLSAEQDTDRQMAARQVGGDDFIPKPVDLDLLVRLVRLRAERARTLRMVMERDGLTGLLNHSRFKERLALELDRRGRTGGQLSLAMVDLDHFKMVNDRHGHLMGDRVIRALARGLTAGLRKSDVVGRYGGEEFAVILLDSGPESAASAMDKVRQRFAAHRFEGGDGGFNVTLSAGIADGAIHRDPESLIEAADQALYAAKREGRNQVRLDAGHLLPRETRGAPVGSSG